MNLLQQIALSLIKGVGPQIAKKLLTEFGSPEAVFCASKAQLLQVEGIGAIHADHILHTDALIQAESQLELITKYKINVLFYTDDAYPRRLKECFDAPLLLYFRGNADLNAPRIVSIVGTRKASLYGLMLCEQLAASLAPFGVLIVSGLAYGIDAAAHTQSLAYGIPTVGVLGHGLDCVYPAAHHHLANRMLTEGGLLTEFLPGSKLEKSNFPKRNRIIAGIADVTIVVEAAAIGGALITADIANSYSRDVFAFPGKTTDHYSAGCNMLIKTNKAGLLQHASDLVYFMCWEAVRPVNTVKQLEIPVALKPIEAGIIKLLNHSPLHIDALASGLSIPQSKLAIELLNLEIKGIIVAIPGNLYQMA